MQNIDKKNTLLKRSPITTWAVIKIKLEDKRPHRYTFQVTDCLQANEFTDGVHWEVPLANCVLQVSKGGQSIYFEISCWSLAADLMKHDRPCFLKLWKRNIIWCLASRDKFGHRTLRRLGHQAKESIRPWGPNPSHSVFPSSGKQVRSSFEANWCKVFLHGSLRRTLIRNHHRASVAEGKVPCLVLSRAT